MMDNRNIITRNTPAWRAQVWLAFGISFTLTLVGIYHMPADLWIKGFLSMGVVFTVTSAFTLSKTIRDDYEADKLLNRIHGAKTEKILKEFEIDKL